MATVRVTQTKCPECSASLEIKAGAESLRCSYCGTALSIENKRPPRDVTLTQPRTIYVPPAMPSSLKAIGWLSGLLPFLIMGGVFWPQLRAYLPVLGNQLPTECGVNGHVSIHDKTFSGTGPLIRGGVNCTIEIKNCKLESDVIIEAGTNNEIEIVGSTLTAKKRAITAEVNVQLHVSGKSQITGAKTALDLGMNAKVRLEDSAIRSPGVALHAESNLSLEATGGSIEGGTAALQVTGNRAQRYEIDGTQIIGANNVKAR